VNGAIGWDHPDTARYYARFQRRFARYRRANRRLVRHAALGPAMRVLDVAAGDGGTAAAALAALGARSRVCCFEPAGAMRALGMRTLEDRRVSWTERRPTEPGTFDRVLCGAAIWQLAPLAETFRVFHALLRPGGCLCFNLPALYLGEPDPPGGGCDPLLIELPAALAAEGAVSGAADERTEPSPDAAPDGPTIDTWLAWAGFQSTRWTLATRFTQRGYREWLKIPPTTDRLLVGRTADERALLIDRAFRRVDPHSWRWERWVGWTAWKPLV
jgi:SAM-dependent methyltransferase